MGTTVATASETPQASLGTSATHFGISSSPTSNTFAMRLFLTIALLTIVPTTLSLPKPGMLIWNCQGCPYPTKVQHADVELSGPSGKVGSLVVSHMVPEGGIGENVEIENVNTRVAFENLQKQRNFDVRIHEGTCESLGEKIHSVRCSNCLNSLGFKVLGSQKNLHVRGDGTEGDLIGKVVLFYDSTRGSKLACGQVKEREQ